jgi:hypothetical protein
MRFIKTLLMVLALMLSFPVQAQAATLTWDHSPDPNIGKYNLYSRTNGLANTNYAVITSVNFPTNVAVVNPPVGFSSSYYVTAVEATTHIESDPSNILDLFTPLGVPPANVLTAKSIDSYTPSTRTWNNVRLAWAPVDARYGVTSFTVVLENAAFTNRFNTTANNYVIPTLSRSDYKLYVLSTNSAGVSPLTAGTIWAISSSAPRSPTNVRSQ